MSTAFHRRILSPHWPIPPGASRFFSAVQLPLPPPARQPLQQQLTAAGAWQTCHLFGHVTGETLRVTHAAALPFPGLNADACVLGARGMGRASDARTDWVGCWLCAPNGRSHTLASTLTRSDASQCTAIFAAQRVPLTAGVENGRLTFTALRALDIDLSPESLPTAQTL